MGSHPKLEDEWLLATERSSTASSENFDLDDIEYAATSSLPPLSHAESWLARLQRKQQRRLLSWQSSFHCKRRKRSVPARILRCSTFILYCVLGLILVYGIFLPSYSHPPRRYVDLRHRVQTLSQTANVNNEKIFIVSSLYDKEGHLVSGHWGRSMRRLIDILGHDNVFLSIYENDADDKSKQALGEFESSLPCNFSIVHEQLDTTGLPQIVMPDGSQRLRRIAFLAEVRNHALRPLQDKQSNAYGTHWDKLLFLNDIAFDPIDAANLLLNTNVNDATGRTDYRAACAVDFSNPFKFYDTFATRDNDGYDTGVPFYPFFTRAGNGTSRRDVIEQRDAVRVKSCWGGMTAFEAKWFQDGYHEDKEGSTKSTRPTSDDDDEASPVNSDRHVNGGYQNPNSHDAVQTHPSLTAVPTTNTTALRFRSDTDPFWDGSECCLIHADLAALTPSIPSPSSADENPGIYMNPFIRVAYSPSVHRWLSFTRRFERLYIWPHHLVNVIGGRPTWNPRRFERAGQEVVDLVWKWDQETLNAIRDGTTNQLEGGATGKFERVRRIAGRGMFCGNRKSRYLEEKRGENGQMKWANAPVPPEVVD